MLKNVFSIYIWLSTPLSTEHDVRTLKKRHNQFFFCLSENKSAIHFFSMDLTDLNGLSFSVKSYIQLSCITI